MEQYQSQKVPRDGPSWQYRISKCSDWSARIVAGGAFTSAEADRFRGSGALAGCRHIKDIIEDVCINEQNSVIEAVTGRKRDSGDGMFWSSLSERVEGKDDETEFSD